MPIQLPTALQEKWQTLSTRERWIAGSGSLLLIIFLIYSFLIEPIVEKMQQLKQDISTETELLSWMQTVVPQINTTQKTAKTTPKDPEALVALIEQSIQQSPLKDSVEEIGLNQQGLVQLQLGSIPLNALISWLYGLFQNQGIPIQQLNIDRTDVPGVVVATVQLGGLNNKQGMKTK